MKFVGVRDFRSRTAEIWSRLEQEREMVITSNGKPVALLTAVNEDNFESALKTLRRARAIDATASIQRHAVSKGLDKLGMDEIDAMVRDTRRSR